MSIPTKLHSVRVRWVALYAAAAVSAVIGALCSFGALALEPLEVLGKLPDPGDKKAKLLPDAYWLRQYTMNPKLRGASLQKEKDIAAGRPVSLGDREIAVWISRNFSSAAEVKDDIDGAAGTPFIRIGGQRPGTENADLLTVTMPYRVKFPLFGEGETALQFTARPMTEADGVAWEISDARLGHARLPGFVADVAVPKVIVSFFQSKDAGAKMYAKLAAYRTVSVRDGKLVFSAALATSVK